MALALLGSRRGKALMRRLALRIMGEGQRHLRCSAHFPGGPGQRWGGGKLFGKKQIVVFFLNMELIRLNVRDFLFSNQKLRLVNLKGHIWLFGGSKKRTKFWFENFLSQISIMVINRFILVWFVLLLFLFCPENAVSRNRVWSDV